MQAGCHCQPISDRNASTELLLYTDHYIICADSTLAWRRQDGVLWLDWHGVYSWMRLDVLVTRSRVGMLISFFSKNWLSFWKNRFFFDYRIWTSLSRYAVVYYV